MMWVGRTERTKGGQWNKRRVRETAYWPGCMFCRLPWMCKRCNDV